jgi:hypothetical protein
MCPLCTISAALSAAAAASTATAIATLGIDLTRLCLERLAALKAWFLRNTIKSVRGVQDEQ